MKFYSKITRKTNSIITEVRDGLKVVSRKRLCRFTNGVLDTENPEIIEKLSKRPDLFRTDKPWPSSRWEDTEEGIELLVKGKELGIDIRHIRKEALVKQIEEKEGKEKKLKSKVRSKVLQYEEILSKAKKLDIPTHKRKKEDIVEDIKKKEVMSNVS